jgi:hypothetical protein
MRNLWRSSILKEDRRAGAEQNYGRGPRLVGKLSSAYVTTPWKPDLSLLIFGQYYNRNETRAEQAGPGSITSRETAYIFQKGKFSADLAYFYGEETSLAGLSGEGRSLPNDLPRGYGVRFRQLGYRLASVFGCE